MNHYLSVYALYHLSSNCSIEVHVELMVDPNMKETFSEPPLKAFNVAPMIRSKLISAFLTNKPNRVKRMMLGMSKCGKD